MKFIPNDKMTCGRNEFRLLLILTLVICFKFLLVDYRIAELLDWPLFGSLSYPVIRHIARAFAVVLPSIAAILCVVMPVSLLPPMYRGKALILVDFLFSVLVFTDILFIRYYGDIFIFHDIMLIPQTGLIAKSIWSLTKFYDVLIFVDIPIIMLLLKEKRISVCLNRVNKKRLLLSVLIMGIAVSVQFMALLRLKENRPNIMNAMYDRLSVCAWVSTSSFHWGDIITLTVKCFESDYIPDIKIKEMEKWFSERRNINYNPIAEGKNLIMVQCEALQYFIIDLEIDGVEVTPNLNRFRKNCLFFHNTWNQTAGGLSSDSEFMANTGMFPSLSGAAYTRFSDNTYNSLAWVLKKKGYRTVVFQGTYSAFWNCHRMHPKLGFERQYSRNTFPDAEVIGLGLSDRTIFTEALNVFRKINGPFYGFIVTLSSHHPFDFKGLDEDASFALPEHLKGTLLGNYLISMHYFDRELGRFLNGIEESGLMDKSLIVVYGDHPAVPIAYKEELEAVLGEKFKDSISWQETRRVPLMFSIPSHNSISRTDDSHAGQMDILPTVAGLMGLEIKTAFGQDLLGTNKNELVVFRNGSYILDGVYVEPAVGRATRVVTHENLDSSKYSKITAEIERQLGYNDLILEKDLIKDILNYGELQK